MLKIADGGMLGLVVWRAERSSFWKRDCAAETTRAPPMDWKTVCLVVRLVGFGNSNV